MLVAGGIAIYVLIPQLADVTVVDFKDLPIPLYEGDLEEAEGIPPNAQKLIDLIRQHQGLLIASPE